MYVVPNVIGSEHACTCASGDGASQGHGSGGGGQGQGLSWRDDGSRRSTSASLVAFVGFVAASSLLALALYRHRRAPQGSVLAAVTEHAAAERAQKFPPSMEDTVGLTEEDVRVL